MDGNGRWAQNRGYGRTRGHREGARRVDDIVSECARIGVQYLTLYAFSTENWNRPSHEVNMLMRLLTSQLRLMDKKFVKNGVQLVAGGTIDRLPKFAQRELKRVMKSTSRPQPKTYLNLALSYGGRQEIVDATRKIAERVQRGELSLDAIDEKLFAQNLYHPEFPDPDLLIRTGGEWRVSNFLLWEIAYSELLVTDVLWPDFKVEELHGAISVFAKRQRRFGRTGEQVLSTGPAASAVPSPL